MRYPRSELAPIADRHETDARQLGRCTSRGASSFSKSPKVCSSRRLASTRRTAPRHRRSARSLRTPARRRKETKQVVTMSSASSLASIQAPPVALRAGALARARASAPARSATGGAWIEASDEAEDIVTTCFVSFLRRAGVRSDRAERRWRGAVRRVDARRREEQTLGDFEKDEAPREVHRPSCRASVSCRSAIGANSDRGYRTLSPEIGCVHWSLSHSFT